MELQELYALMERFSASGLTQLDWRRKDEQITLCKAAAPAAGTERTGEAAAPAPAAPAPAAEENVVKSPLVGVFYAASAPEGEPLAPAGKRLRQGEAMCIIEAMKMMSEVPAPCDCVVEEVLAQDGAAVGFGEPLFRIKRT